MSSTASVGTMLREWRERRRLTQLTLACDAEISTRHLSFLETGRSTPTSTGQTSASRPSRLPVRFSAMAAAPYKSGHSAERDGP
jgi:hypothetical protein